MTELLPVGPPVDPTPAGALTREPMRGHFVEIAPIDPERDARDLFAPTHGSAEREAVWTYLSYGPFSEEETLRAWLTQASTSSDPLFFAVRDLASGRAVGVVSYLAIARSHRRVEIGHIWYVPEAQRGVTNTEAVCLLLRRAAELGYRRIEWKCDALNARSARSARRLGFTFEGTFRAHLIVKDRNRDTAWFSILAEEWPAIEHAMQAWLTWEGAERPSLEALRDELARRGGL